MSAASPYDDYLMDHIKNARNYRVPDDADYSATGSNPLCGDEITVYLKMEDGRIDDVAFQCTCCGISMASASIMTEVVKGTAPAEAQVLASEFVEMLTREQSGAGDALTEDRMALLDTVRKYPSRARCAVLPWQTLESALASGE
jgi:nitrogen fixation NifU-like protein